MNNNFIPNSFQVPNALIDDLLMDLSGAELKCYLFVVRKTKGWNKESDSISISQFMAVTGLSNKSVITACNRLVELGLLVQSTGSRGAKVYSVNLCKNFTSEKSSPVKKVHSTCEKSTQEPVKKVHTQNNNIKNTTKKTNNPLNPPAGETQGESKNLLDYLNGRLVELSQAINQPLPKFKPVDSTLKNIKARIAESSVDDCQRVVDYLVAKWGRDVKMREYLAPKTIFRASNFADYLPKAIAWAESGKPVCVNGKWVSESEAIKQAGFDLPSVDEVRSVYQRYLNTPTLFNRTDFNNLRKKFMYYSVVKTKNAKPTESNINSVIAGIIKTVAAQINDLPTPSLGAN